MESCNNCWWFCHSNRKCFRSSAMIAVSIPKEMKCEQWAYDGLEEWERDDALMTMEESK